MKPYVDKALDAVAKSNGAEDFTGRYYADCLEFPNQDFWNGLHTEEDWSFGADPLEVCTKALAFLALSNGDARTAIIGAINFGRDCDTISGIAAAFCGALNGPETVPSEWQDAIVKANPDPDIKEYCLKLCELLLQNLDSLSEQVSEIRASNCDTVQRG